MQKAFHRSVSVAEIRDTLRAMPNQEFQELRQHVRVLLLMEGDEIVASWLYRLNGYLTDEYNKRLKLSYKRLREDIPYPCKRRTHL